MVLQAFLSNLQSSAFYSLEGRAQAGGCTGGTWLSSGLMCRSSFPHRQWRPVGNSSHLGSGI